MDGRQEGRQPERSDTYLTYSKGERNPYRLLHWEFDGESWTDEDDWEVTRVTHWMDFPAVIQEAEK